MATARQRRERRRRLPLAVEPRSIERQYTRELVNIARMVTIDVRRLINELRPELDTTRGDGLVIRLDDLRSALAQVERRRRMFAAVLNPDRLRGITTGVGLEVERHNEKQIRRQVVAAIELSPELIADPALTVGRVGAASTTRLLDSWTRSNVSLIKSIPEETYRRVEKQIRVGFSKGLRHEQIAKGIMGQTAIGERRARLIARDQVGKLNGELTRARHEALGAKRYRWRTSLDERVREDHQLREGVVFSWDAPPFDGHPGEPINCRCTAEPMFEELET